MALSGCCGILAVRSRSIRCAATRAPSALGKFFACAACRYCARRRPCGASRSSMPMAVQGILAGMRAARAMAASVPETATGNTCRPAATGCEQAGPRGSPHPADCRSRSWAVREPQPAHEARRSRPVTCVSRCRLPALCRLSSVRRAASVKANGYRRPCHHHHAANHALPSLRAIVSSPPALRLCRPAARRAWCHGPAGIGADVRTVPFRRPSLQGLRRAHDRPADAGRRGGRFGGRERRPGNRSRRRGGCRRRWFQRCSGWCRRRPPGR